jgi:hypothetical protein
MTRNNKKNKRTEYESVVANRLENADEPPVASETADVQHDRVARLLGRLLADEWIRSRGTPASATPDAVCSPHGLFTPGGSAPPTPPKTRLMAPKTGI